MGILFPEDRDTTGGRMTGNSHSNGGGGTPRRQHYVSAMLLKQWGDQVEGRDTVIGRFDMHTRQTSKGTAGAECVFEDVLGAQDGGQDFLAALKESEDEWRSVEDTAAVRLDQISNRMGTGGGFSPDIRNILQQAGTLDVLRRLAVLHHGRNLRAIIKCWREAMAGGASADERAERLRASIAARMADAEERYRGGVVFATPESGHEFVLGSVPVSEDEVYGPSNATAEFMMPLTPLLMMAVARNSLDMADDAQFMVCDERIVRVAHYDQSARTFGSPLVYCRPSYLAEAEASVGEFTFGGSWHWRGLERRSQQYRHRVPHRQQTRIRRVLQEQQRRRAACGSNAASGSPTHTEDYRQWRRAKADELERILNRAGVPPAEQLPPLSY